MIHSITGLPIRKTIPFSNKYCFFSFLKIFSILILTILTHTAIAQQIITDSTFYIKNTTDTNAYFVVKNIYLSGNKKTKDFIILREMPVQKGDSINADNLNAQLEKARELIHNTTLFEKVTVLPVLLNTHELDILITVNEKWYIYPIPTIELADRSFNEWIHTHNADLERLSYGIRFSHFNFSGKRDVLSLDLINGFRRKISIDYSLPYINKALTNGFKFGAGFSQTKEIPYATDAGNKLLYYENDGYEMNEWNVSASYVFRKKIKKKETFSVKFTHLNISDSVSEKYNPGFFNSRTATQEFVDLKYELKYDDVDNIMYPLRGNSFSLLVNKRGLGFTGGLNFFSVMPAFNQYFTHPKSWYSSIRLSGEIKLPFTQPYYNTKALGYEDNYIRGLEYFVIDGVAFGLGKFDLKKKILHFEVPVIFKTNLVDKIPFTFYAKTYTDVGYVYNRFDSRLNNRFLYGGGFGIDIITLYDFSISIEYSFNQLGQKGLFLHR